MVGFGFLLCRSVAGGVGDGYIRWPAAGDDGGVLVVAIVAVLEIRQKIYIFMYIYIFLEFFAMFYDEMGHFFDSFYFLFFMYTIFGIFSLASQKDLCPKVGGLFYLF